MLREDSLDPTFYYGESLDLPGYEGFDEEHGFDAPSDATNYSYDGHFDLNVPSHASHDSRSTVLHQTSDVSTATNNHTDSVGASNPTCSKCSTAIEAADPKRRPRRERIRVKKYACAICAASFPFVKDLRRHERIHTGDRPYRCPHASCKYALAGFARKDNRDRHVQAVHVVAAEPVAQ